MSWSAWLLLQLLRREKLPVIVPVLELGSVLGLVTELATVWKLAVTCPGLLQAAGR